MNYKEFLNFLRLCWFRVRFKLVFLVVLSIFSSALELLGFGMIIPLITYGFSESSQPNLFLEYFEIFLNYFSFPKTLEFLLLLITLIFLLKNIVVFLVEVINVVTLLEFSNILETDDPTRPLLPTTNTLIFNPYNYIDIVIVKIIFSHINIEIVEVCKLK